MNVILFLFVVVAFVFGLITTELCRAVTRLRYRRTILIARRRRQGQNPIVFKYHLPVHDGCFLVNPLQHANYRRGTTVVDIIR